MRDGLKLGIAGLGTVGSGLLQLLQVRGSELAARAGRAIEVVAVSAKDRRKNRDADIRHSVSFDDPVALAKDPSIDVFVELIGGEDGVAKEAVEAALRAGKHVVTANKALLAQHGPELAALAEKNGVALNFEARGGRRHSRHQDDAREPRRQRDPPRLRHPQRHLQLHPDADGAEEQRPSPTC